MTVQNNPQGTDARRNNPRRKSCGFSLIILIILILPFFFWRFIPVSDTAWTGTIKSGFPSGIVVSNSLIASPSGVLTTTVYDDDYLRWAGQVKAGQCVVWSGITVQSNSNEIPVGGATGPRAPCIVYGNVHVMTGNGINFLIFDEANFNAWQGGNSAAYAVYRAENTSDFNYVLNVSQGVYYIVVDNKGSATDALVRFTGSQAYVRPLDTGESPMTEHWYPDRRWDMKNEKLSAFEYILRIFNSPSSVAQTPPALLN